MSLNDKSCMTRPTLIDLNPAKFYNSQLVQIDLMEVVIMLLMTYPYLFREKQKVYMIKYLI